MKPERNIKFDEVYKSKPLNKIKTSGQSIPVFVLDDSYIENYEQISQHHLMEATEERSNPFVDESFIRNSEEITFGLAKVYSDAQTNVLDIGCGEGRLLAMFSEGNLFGTDISEGYLLKASRGEAELCKARVEDLPYKKEIFDLVTCTDVLEHVFDLNAAIREIFRVLKPTGKLVIRVPYREDLSLYLSDEFNYRFGHIRNFDESGLRLLFEKVFLAKVCHVAFGPYLIAPVYLKYGFRFRGLSFLLRLLDKFIQKFPPELKLRIIRSHFWPVEIHLVISK